MDRTALIVVDGSPKSSHIKLSHVLDFFGVPWEAVDISKLSDIVEGTHESVVFGFAETVASVHKQIQQANHPVLRPAAFYAYTSDDWRATEHALQFLCGHANLSLQEAPAGKVSLRISAELADMAGPMAGLEVLSSLRKEDAVLVGVAAESSFATVMAARGFPVFVRSEQSGVPFFFCASSHMVDMDQTVGPGFYDVKDHFCSVVPLVMFLRLMFPNIAWQPQELGACLIVDDPLLRKRYGACDFGQLRDLMRRHDFTTNIAFIPWNWRRTSSIAGEFFRNEFERYSVSIHGCDHIGAEFGATSLEILDTRAKLAQSRMRNHEARTGIHHDPVMIFPQGVFSSVCPEVLKRNGFLAAVNTETVPVDSQCAQTRIRDVWDVAIMSYGSFPIFTRRYPFHGLENFAFDLLLGKPCLIVSHHDYFKNRGTMVIELIGKLQSLNCHLRWRPLGEVIRRACRRRVSRTGVEEAEMYGNEFLIDNPSDQTIEVEVRKRECQADLVADILCDGKPARWTSDVDRLVFGESIRPRGQRRFQVIYREQAGSAKVDRSLRFELSVAARRILSEFRDDYLSKSRFLGTTSANLKNALTRIN